MTTTLSTNWLRIGRSGATVDGRTIPPLALTQAAESYSPELFTALIWLEHMRMGGHLGKVLALKSEQNEEGGIDLFAQLSPNRNYLAENSIYQEGWFSSMELTPDFRKSGKWYLTGLGATNEPASVATTEIRFAKQAEKAGEILGAYVQTESKQFTKALSQEKSFFNMVKQFFTSNETTTENDMSDPNYLQLKQDLDAVKAKLETFSQQKNDDKQQPPNDDVVRLTKENAELKAQIEASKADDAKRGEEFNALRTQVETLSTTLAAALAEQPGTQSHSNTGAAETTAKLA